MTAWFVQQIDFVFFIYGASFSAFAVFASLADKKGQNSARVPWMWAASFAAIHGVHEWAEMLNLSISNANILFVRVLLLSISFWLLFEFGRRAILLQGRLSAIVRALPVALFAPAAAFAARGAHAESEAAIRLLVAAPASALAALALWRAARAPEESARAALQTAALTIAVYGVAAGLISSPADWGLSRAWNTETWLAHWGFPVQLLRTACAVVLTLCVWRCAMTNRSMAERSSVHHPSPPFRATLIALALVAFAACVGADAIARVAGASIRRSMLERATAIAQMLDSGLLSALRASPHEEDHPVVRAVTDQLTRAKRAFPDIEQIYLYALRGRDFVFYACCESTNPHARIHPGEIYEGDITPDNYSVFEQAQPQTFGPFSDRWGRWVSAVVPALMGPENDGRVRLALGIDIAAETYIQFLRRWRLIALGTGALLILLILDFFSRHHRLWMAAMQLAEAERKQRQLSEELERRVDQRTRELAEANAALHREMTGHREAVAKYRALTERVPAITYRVDLHPAPRTTYISPQLREVLGYSPEEWMADPELWKRALHPDDRDRVLAAVQEADRAGRPLTIDFRMRANNGDVRWIRHGSSYQRDDNGRPAFIHGVMIDVTEQVETDARLKETGERYRLLFKHTPAGLIQFNQALRITDVNDRFAQLLKCGTTELMGADLNELATPDLLAAFKSALAGGESYYEGPDGFRTQSADAWIGVRTAALFGADRSVIGGIAFVEDLSARRRIEEERMRTQKLESLGLLAGGLAHDFNNILTAVLGNISIARTAAPTGSELREPLQDAERAALRARDLTQQLLTFAKGGAPIKKLHNIAALVREAASFTVRGSASRCVYELAPDTWNAEVDAGQITQVIQNLILNADQAMPAGGTITLQTANRQLAPGEVGDLPAGPYVEIKVRDTGVGIPHHLRNRIFDPYFTTKKKGSGLGLTMCFSIMQKHGGYIGLDSIQGAGSTFILLLPASSATPAPERAPVADPPHLLEGEERILIMDDERAILALARRTLTRHGYTVLTAEHGEQAIRIFDEERAAGRKLDLVILDITVPGGMGGRETLRRLRERDPNLIALVSSGYAQDDALAQFREAGFSGMVPKPYRIEELLTAIRSALIRAPSV